MGNYILFSKIKYYQSFGGVTIDCISHYRLSWLNSIWGWKIVFKFLNLFFHLLSVSVVEAFNNFGLDLLEVICSLVVHDELHGHLVFLLHESCLQLFQLLLRVAENNDVGDVRSWCQPIFEKRVNKTNSGSSRNNESGLDTRFDKINCFCFIIAKFEIDKMLELLLYLFLI